MSTPKKLQEPQQTDADWPYIARLRPKTALAGMTLLLLLAWSIFLAIDILGWFNPVLERPVWQMLFNDRPVEWMQWLVLALSTVLSGYVAGRLDAGNHTRPARFFLWLAAGFGLMLIEDTGNIRHILNEEIVRLTGPNIFSVPSGFMVEAPYFLGLAAVPIYALARYGRHVWHVRSTRLYLVAGFLLYGLAAGGSALSNLFHSYIGIGSWFDATLLGERLAPLPGRTQELTYFLFVDSAIEETLELIAITLLAAAVLAFVEYLRQRSAEQDT